MGNIDRADWHYGGSYPPSLPRENGGTHIGMYLAWIVERGLASARFVKEAGASIEMLRERQITGRHLLFTEFDETFFDTLLTKIGKDFTRDYYATHAYFVDYASALADGLPSTYHVDDSWENYEKIRRVIDERFADWQRGVKPAPPAFYVERKESERGYMDAVRQAAGQLNPDPRAAIKIFEAYLSTDPVEPYRDMAIKELERLWAKLAH